MYAADIEHLDDHQKALVLAKTLEGARLRKKLRRIAKANARKRDPAALKRLEAYYEAQRATKPANLADATLRFPGLGPGYSTIRLDLIKGSGEPQLHVCTAADYVPLHRQLGDWHSRYPGASKKEPNAFWPVTEAGDGRVGRDHRFAYATVTLPKWDTDALQAAVAAGELTEAQVCELFVAQDRWTMTDGGRHFSCGAAKPLLFAGSDYHLIDGTVHQHPKWLKSARAGYRRADGTLQSRSEAPQRGRARKGEGWEGGERLGLIAGNGHLVFNTLGVAGCAADALREEGFEPPEDFKDVDEAQGKRWAVLDRSIQRRRDGGFSLVTSEGKTVWVKETGVRAGPDGKGLGLDPADLVASRHFRQLVRDLAERVPAFAKRRAELIAKAKADKAQVNRDLLRLVAGDELARRDVELDAKDGKIRDLTELLDSERADLDAERQERERLERESATKIAALEQRLAAAPKESPDLAAKLDKAQKTAAGALAAVTASAPTLYGFLRQYAITGKIPAAAKGLMVAVGEGRLSLTPLVNALRSVLGSTVGTPAQLAAAKNGDALAHEFGAFVSTKPSDADWAAKRAEWAKKYPAPEPETIAERRAAAAEKRATTAEEKHKNLLVEADAKFRAFRDQAREWADKRVKAAVAAAPVPEEFVKTAEQAVAAQSEHAGRLAQLLLPQFEQALAIVERRQSGARVTKADWASVSYFCQPGDVIGGVAWTADAMEYWELVGATVSSDVRQGFEQSRFVSMATAELLAEAAEVVRMEASSVSKAEAERSSEAERPECLDSTGTGVHPWFRLAAEIAIRERKAALDMNALVQESRLDFAGVGGHNLLEAEAELVKNAAKKVVPIGTPEKSVFHEATPKDAKIVEHEFRNAASG